MHKVSNDEDQIDLLQREVLRLHSRMNRLLGLLLVTVMSLGLLGVVNQNVEEMSAQDKIKEIQKHLMRDSSYNDKAPWNAKKIYCGSIRVGTVGNDHDGNTKMRNPNFDSFKYGDTQNADEYLWTDSDDAEEPVRFFYKFQLNYPKEFELGEPNKMVPRVIVTGVNFNKLGGIGSIDVHQKDQVYAVVKIDKMLLENANRAEEGMSRIDFIMIER